MATASSRKEPKTMEFTSTAQSHFDCMMKLLLFQEVELQFKEEIISLLMVGVLIFHVNECTCVNGCSVVVVKTFGASRSSRVFSQAQT